MSSIYEQSSLCVTPNAKKAGKLYALKGADLDVVRATTATYVGSDGLIKTSLANEVRFDYTNGSCPSILVEPQRTNLFTYSEQFNNGAWSKINSTVASNTTTAPNGTLTADSLIDNSTNTIHVISNSGGGTGVFTFSFYAKANTLNRIGLLTDAAVNTNLASTAQVFDLLNGTVVNTISGVTASIETLANSWFRCSVTLNSLNSGSYFITCIKTGTNIGYVGSGESVYIWGAQLEAGANATSYIPTVASAVTRNADVISKSGIADLIGQTEGTIFCDVNLNRLPIGNQTALILGFNNTVNSVRIRFRVSMIEGLIFYNNSIAAQISTNISQAGRYKISLSYNNNYAALFVNGVKVGQDLTVSTQDLSSIGLGSFSSGFEQLNDSINSAVIWKTQLTDQECINLTTI